MGEDALPNHHTTYNNGSNQINHDADGNMTAGPLYRQGVIQTANFTYDARNRLTAVDDTTYLYDAENNRIGVTENGIQYDYVINPNAALSQALVRTGPSGEQTFYVYGLGLIGQEEDGVYLNYHYDRQGSTAALTDMDGSVVERFQYSPEGNLGYRSGSTSTPFLYLGQYGVMTDANGLNYMRARYYSPLMDRFINEDTFDGRYDDLLNLNLYVYCKNNPVMFIDPTGLTPEDYDPEDDPSLKWAAAQNSGDLESPIYIAYNDVFTGDQQAVPDEFWVRFGSGLEGGSQELIDSYGIDDALKQNLEIKGSSYKVLVETGQISAKAGGKFVAKRVIPIANTVFLIQDATTFIKGYKKGWNSSD